MREEVVARIRQVITDQWPAARVSAFLQVYTLLFRTKHTPVICLRSMIKCNCLHTREFCVLRILCSAVCPGFVDMY